MNKITKTILIIAGVLVFAGVAEAKVLTVGSTGSEVAKLQTFLIDNGYTIPLIESGVASKGYFGEQTENAVKMYQEDNETNPTGSIDSSAYSVKPIKLGAVSGPDNSSPFWKQNGVQFDYFNQGFMNTGSTTCSFAITATSTLVAFTTHTTRLASSTMAEIGTAATRYATTTSLGKATFATGGGLLTASTTSAFGLQLTPGTFLNMKIGGGDTAGTVTPIGVCKAVTIKLDNLN